MTFSLTGGALLLIVAFLLCLPEVRAYLVSLELRRFFRNYISRPRYRVYNLRDEEDGEA